MTGIIILAAGASTRLGRSKQMVPYHGSSLLKHTIRVALDADIGPVIVVMGANEKEISAHIDHEDVNTVVNENYKEGIASSIRTGINDVEEYHEDCENIILMVCDQPYVNKELLKSLLEAKHTTKKTMVASAYKDTIGVPALFDKRFFPELLSLQGEEGGKKVLLKHPESLATVPFPLGEIDIDTPADLNALDR